MARINKEVEEGKGITPKDIIDIARCQLDIFVNNLRLDIAREDRAASIKRFRGHTADCKRN